MNSYNISFPFVAVIGQEAVKKALILNIINPSIKGVLISGDKGSAKSTLVRGLGNILEDTNVVELPLNVTEDRLSGSIDFEYAIKKGKKRFEEGILKRADGNLLYIDEINLLSDNIIKNLLEVSSSDENIVEREGISFSHASKFILVGSMNPEEGELRSQFLDRIGLFVEVKSEKDPRKRVEIIKRCLEYDQNPIKFINKYKEENEKLKTDIKRAKYALNKVEVTENSMNLASSISKEANCAGHRAEIIIIETAKAIASLDGRVAINIDDIKEASKFVLPHRIRKKSDETNKDNNEDLEENESNNNTEKGNEQEDNQNEENNQKNNTDEQKNKNEETNNKNSSEEETKNIDDDNIEKNKSDNNREIKKIPDKKENEELNDTSAEIPLSEFIDDIGESFSVTKWLGDKEGRAIDKGSGKRSIVKTSLKQGRYIKYSYPKKGNISDIAIDATIRVAATNQNKRDRKDVALALEKSDIRVKKREKRTGNTIIFVVDASGSMGANKRMKSVKGAIVSLLNDAYQKRDKVGMIAFRNDSAQIILNITRSVDLAEKKLKELPTGGRTPLAAGLDKAYEVIKAGKIKDKDMLPVIVLVSDGRATYSKNGIDPFKEALISAKKIATEKIKTIVIDAEESFIKLELAKQIALEMDSNLFKVDDLHSDGVVAAVKLSL